MDRIGKYEIHDKIGSGGFAVVYKGYDPFIKRPVAIKVCHSHERETRERFYREAEIAGRMVHRNITTVYDFGLHEESRTPYLVEEYLPGEDLAHMIRRHQPESLAVKLEYLVQIADGLGYAHSQGVIHRDVKPANIRVLGSGRIKIMDFGTAKFANVESKLTQTGMTLGTVAYLSPERLLGQSSGINADIFSYGVLAYELLSFRRPFSGRNIPHLIDQVLNAAPVPLDESWPECPPGLAQIVHRCLKKDPAERYPTCEPLQADLERLRLEMGLAAPATFRSESSSAILRFDLQLSGLLERARLLHDSGKFTRAELLLEEVLEIDPEHRDALALAASCRSARERAEGSARAADRVADGGAAAGAAAGETSDERRLRRVGEASSSIRRYADAGRLVEAAEALRFATGLLGSFAETAELRRRLARELGRQVVELKSASLRQARRIVEVMEKLRAAGRLPVEVAESLCEWVGELDPDDLAARNVLSALVSEDRRQQALRRARSSDRKKQEAVASIEKLLAEGNPAMAEKALHFAVRLLGDFEQITQLRHRIDEAMRQQG